ncbi:hypothetical protein BAZOLSSOX_309 [uncultured Gammaproteobacteria bacterium]|nr:hypothetical protein BAZOLSSOX_309 [uncultured Gammaproteobacteria bacterium]
MQAWRNPSDPDSPPHRWLRKCHLLKQIKQDYSPPHRWLRKLLVPVPCFNRHSPPHRWLRNFIKSR